MGGVIKVIVPGSPAFRAGLTPGMEVVQINGYPLSDILDYYFYSRDERAEITISDGRRLTIRNPRGRDFGIQFTCDLFDGQRSCYNNCVFCFIDQLPKGMRSTMYYKDDDYRLSLLCGNYVTLTNATEGDIERIIRLRLSPVNVSVHATSGDIRTKLLRNKNARNILPILTRLNDNGIIINAQIVVVPEFNDGECLRQSLNDLSLLRNVNSLSCVPVGLTAHREGLFPIKKHTKETAQAVIDMVEHINASVRHFAYASDEFYLLAQTPIPPTDYYNDFPQIENGVGLMANLMQEFEDAIEKDRQAIIRVDGDIAIATGHLAHSFMTKLAQMAEDACGARIRVYEVANDFFGQDVTVSGLVTGGDLINQLRGIKHQRLLIPTTMLRQDSQIFLDDVTLQQAEKQLNIPITPCPVDGYTLWQKLYEEGCPCRNP